MRRMGGRGEIIGGGLDNMWCSKGKMEESREKWRKIFQLSLVLPFRLPPVFQRVRWEIASSYPPLQSPY